MQLLITVPRSGSHLFGKMMRFKMVVTFRAGQPLPEYLPMSKHRILEILYNLRKQGRYWLHLPFDREYQFFVEHCERAFLLLRDPRDVIVSHAHIVDTLPSIGLNYLLGDKLFSDLSMKKRIDFLIEHMRPLFEWYEDWRNSGLDVVYYEEFVNSPAKIYEKLEQFGYGTQEELAARARARHPYHFRRGTVGEWEEIFTEGQKRKALENFGDLIEAWKAKK